MFLSILKNLAILKLFYNCFINEDEYFVEYFVEHLYLLSIFKFLVRNYETDVEWNKKNQKRNVSHY